MKRLPFKIVAEYLGYKTSRAVKSWCKRRNVPCFKDGKCWYIFEDEFLRYSSQIPKEEKNSTFAPIKIRKFRPTTSIALSFEKKFAHIP